MTKKNIFLSEKKPQRVETDLSEENAVKYSHPPSNTGIIMDNYFFYLPWIVFDAMSINIEYHT